MQVKDELEIRLLRRDEISRIVPLLDILNDRKMPEATIRARLDEMLTQGYECVAAFHGERIVGCSGVWIFTKVYCGRFIEPDNVCVDPEYRSHGVGAVSSTGFANMANPEDATSAS